MVRTFSKRHEKENRLASKRELELRLESARKDRDYFSDLSAKNASKLQDAESKVHAAERLGVKFASTYSTWASCHCYEAKLYTHKLVSKEDDGVMRANYKHYLRSDKELFALKDDIRVALGLDDDVDVAELFHDAANFNRRIDEQSNQELAWSVVNGVPVDFGEEDGDE